MMSAQTEIIEIAGLPRGTKKAIEELSRSKGKSAEEYLRMLIEAELLSEQTFSEMLAPIRQSFRESKAGRIPTVSYEDVSPRHRPR